MTKLNELDRCPVEQQAAIQSLFRTLKLTNKKLIRKHLKEGRMYDNGDVGFIFKENPEWTLVVTRDGSYGKSPANHTNRVDPRWIGTRGPARCADDVGMVLKKNQVKYKQHRASARQIQQDQDRMIYPSKCEKEKDLR